MNQILNHEIRDVIYYVYGSQEKINDYIKSFGRIDFYSTSKHKTKKDLLKHVEWLKNEHVPKIRKDIE